jgi:hypothetical protein
MSGNLRRDPTTEKDGNKFVDHDKIVGLIILPLIM